MSKTALQTGCCCKTLLARYGQCHVAVHGKEDVDAFRLTQRRGDEDNLICMDIAIPKMDGHQAVQEIGRLENAVRSVPVTIVVVTASNDGENVNMARQEGCDGYLVKPIDARRLRPFSAGATSRNLCLMVLHRMLLDWRLCVRGRQNGTLHSAPYITSRCVREAVHLKSLYSWRPGHFGARQFNRRNRPPTRKPAD